MQAAHFCLSQLYSKTPTFCCCVLPHPKLPQPLISSSSLSFISVLLFFCVAGELRWAALP